MVKEKRSWKATTLIVTYLLLLLLFIATCVQNKIYNGRVHVLDFGEGVSEAGTTYDDNISACLRVRGYETGEYATWRYDTQEEDPEALVGGIYELTVSNHSKYRVNEWTAEIYFPEFAYVNSGWNGDFTLHQQVATGEKVQTFPKGNLNLKDMDLDYEFDGVCMLVGMEAGDYFTYVPARASQEVPLNGKESDATIGFILYTRGEDASALVPFTQGCVQYKMYRDLWREPAFIPFLVLFLAWIVAALVTLLVYLNTRRLRLQNELLARENEKVRAENRQYVQDLEAAKAEADRANKAKTEFLFNMSHDIRTPMNAIMGFTELLERNLDNQQKSVDYLGKIKRSSEFLLSLINNVLEMARVESGNVVLEESVHKSGDILHSLNEVFEERMAVKHISYSSSIDVQTEYFYADKLKVNEIFLNLLSNAYKYTPEGGSISFDVRELPCDREGYVTIQSKISDTGIGMTAEFLPHLFDEFSRETSTTDKKIEGTGLGMPIVKRLVTLMDGDITVESELGKGSTFIVTLTHRICNEVVEEKAITEAVETVDLSGKRVLLAEDNDLNAEIAIEILEESGTGLIIDRAEDGQACVEMVEAAEPGYYDLILMDVQMPRMNGYEATRAIRAMEDDVKSKILIIAMTANAFEEDKRNALEAGMNAHITKPIVIPVLIETISQILAGK